MSEVIHPCCLKTFPWDGEPTGRVSKLGKLNCYIAGDNPDVAILYIHDLLTWKFPNNRLLCDVYAMECNATVYMPDFFDGEEFPFEPILKGRFHEIDLAGFSKRNARSIREPEIFGAARMLRGQYKKLAAIGYCFGGWAVHRLGAKEHNPALVDCISAGHPSWLTKQDIDEATVPTQILAPEIDAAFTPELKQHFFTTMMKNGVIFSYEHFPGAEHACFTRGDLNVKNEREVFEQGKAAAVAWMNRYLH